MLHSSFKTEFNNFCFMWNKKFCTGWLIYCTTFLLVGLVIGCKESSSASNEWKAPAASDDLKSPFSFDLVSEEKGRSTYNLYCRSCHGESGLGNGPAGKDLVKRPASFHAELVRKQSDGSLFWKLSHGNTSMPAFKDVLTEEQRWQLVSYLRKLPNRTRSDRSPIALMPDIKIEHFMKIGPQAVRILHHTASGNLWYTSFDGNVYRIRSADSARTAEKVLSVQDHGIEVLQGAIFLHDTLFLCGNSYFEDKKVTQGRLVRFTINDTSKSSAIVVFNTVKYPANKTIYDHGWNALAISPDEQYLFVNSGARTDHGEVQDNGGLFPNARDNALTAKVFRFPVSTTNLELPDNEGQLRRSGYLYASGIRNAYDMAFDRTGHLFGVVNSADYDYPEDMFWIRQDHHFGFPWLMGGLENPQQYRDWKPDPDTDPFINRFSHSWKVKYYHTDTTFPPRPPGVRFSPGVQNLGPDANEYRGHSGKIQDGDQTGLAVSTFTPHCCPLGLCFDTKNKLSGEFKGSGFVIRFSGGRGSGMMMPFTDEGTDLLHLRMSYDSLTNNYFTRTKRIVGGFSDPVDAVLIDNEMYVIEYGGEGGNIWKIIFPGDKARSKNTITK
jgi:glucose/arabinose dehydrogenase